MVLYWMFSRGAQPAPITQGPLTHLEGKYSSLDCMYQCLLLDLGTWRCYLYYACGKEPLLLFHDLCSLWTTVPLRPNFDIEYRSLGHSFFLKVGCGLNLGTRQCFNPLIFIVIIVLLLSFLFLFFRMLF